MWDAPGHWSMDQAINYMGKRDAALSAVISIWPFPHWIKFWTDGDDWPRMVYINAAYEKWYGMEKEAYIERTDNEVWPIEVARRMLKNDREATEQPEVLLECIEPTARRIHIGSGASKHIATRVDTEQWRGWAIYGESG